MRPVYLEHGKPVRLLIRWASPTPAEPDDRFPHLGKPRRSPRNVLIERADGTRVVRPFRGLRVPP